MIINNVGIGELNLTKLIPRLSQLDFCSFSITSFSCLFRLAISSFFSNFLEIELRCFLRSSFPDFKFSGCFFMLLWSFFDTSCSELAIPPSQR